jgi:hypothetical protein
MVGVKSLRSSPPEDTVVLPMGNGVRLTHSSIYAMIRNRFRLANSEPRDLLLPTAELDQVYQAALNERLRRLYIQEARLILEHLKDICERGDEIVQGQTRAERANFVIANLCLFGPGMCRGSVRRRPLVSAPTGEPNVTPINFNLEPCWEPHMERCGFLCGGCVECRVRLGPDGHEVTCCRTCFLPKGHPSRYPSIFKNKEGELVTGLCAHACGGLDPEEEA